MPNLPRVSRRGALAIYRFCRLPVRDQLFVLHAAMLLTIYAVRLRCCPSRTMQRALNGGTGCDRRGRCAVERIVWAVRVASCYVPGMTCLERALATLHLLAQHGWSAVLRIGVSATRAGPVEAHAWVELDGCVVMGKVNDFARFRALRRSNQ